MTTRTKRMLFFIAYGYVLVQFFAMFVTTIALVQLGAPDGVQTAAYFASLVFGVAALVVISLRPALEREFAANPSRTLTENRELRTENHELIPHS